MLRGDRYDHLLIEPSQGLRAETRARLRDAGLARGPYGLTRLGKPLNAFEQAAQNFTIGGLHVQRQRDHVVHHQMRRQLSLPEAGFTGLGQNRIDFLSRNRSADHSQADVVRDAASGGQFG